MGKAGALDADARGGMCSTRVTLCLSVTGFVSEPGAVLEGSSSACL